jgi:hypothetical protein
VSFDILPIACYFRNFSKPLEIDRCKREEREGRKAMRRYFSQVAMKKPEDE